MNKNWKYSIKSGHFEATVLAQRGCCAICNLPSTELLLDHCHKTEKLRELLCRKCNSLLGMCNDSVEVLQNAIAYLKKHSTEE